jgi:putative ABC transport system permease protein
MTRLYRALLWLYPASFRAEYGAEMSAVFADRRRESGGPLAVLLLWLDTATDVIRNALLAHWDILRQDLRYVTRSLIKSPGFAVTAILVTMLGVGANAAAFSVTDFALIRPLPFPNPDRLVRLWERTPGYREMELSPPNFHDWQAMSQSFESMGAYWSFSVNLVGGAEPETVQGSALTPEVIPLLGIKPLLGRAFSEEEGKPGAPRTLVLSYGYWQSRFGGSPGVLGTTLSLDGRPYQVIGVMPPGFQFPDRTSRVWTTVALDETDNHDRTNNALEVVARLKAGVSKAQAQTDLDVISARLAQAYPAENKDIGATIEWLRDQMSDNSRLLLLALSGGSLCILLIACANLGSLLLARGVAREHELAVRTALGAGRERLVRQLITESLVLAGVGGTLGVLTAMGALPLLSRLIPDSLPFAGGPSINLRVLAFAAALTVVTCLLFAVLPALRSGGRGDVTALREGGRASGGRRERLRAVLVTIEVTASVVLLIASGLLMRAIQRVQDVDPGFRTEGIFTVRTALPQPGYSRVADRQRFYAQVLSGVRSLPGVTGAAYISALPMVFGGGIWPVQMGDKAEIRDVSNTASMRFATPGYFNVLDIPFVAGRDIAETDRQSTLYVAVVSESFAKRYWPNQNPLGRRFTMAFHEREVVGVVADIKVRGLERTSEPQAYFPSTQAADSEVVWYEPKDLAIRSNESSATLLPAVTRIVHTADPDQAVSDPRTMAEIVAEQVASRAVQLRVLGALAAIALILAGVGIHGLLSFMVSQRSREIGVRMALGAQTPDVLGLVLRRGLWLAVGGVIPGAFIAWIAGRAMQAVLFGVPPADLPTFVLVIGLCLITALAGCLAPAVRAVRMDPIRVLRAE